MKNNRYQWEKRRSSNETPAKISFVEKNWFIYHPTKSNDFLIPLPNIQDFYEPLTFVKVTYKSKNYTLKLKCEDSKHPTLAPTKKPTLEPTENPTQNPTTQPTLSPTKKPTNHPTQKPTQSPTKKPTKNPTVGPTRAPTKKPTFRPTEMCHGLKIDGGPSVLNINGIYHKLSNMKNDRFQWEKRQSSHEKEGKIIVSFEGEDWFIYQQNTNGVRGINIKLPNLRFFYEPLTSVTIVYQDKSYSLNLKCEDTKHPTVAPTLKPTLEPTKKPTITPTLQPTSRPTEICLGLQISGSGLNKVDGTYHRLSITKNDRYQWEKRTPQQIMIFFDGKDWVIVGDKWKVILSGLSDQSGFYEQITQIDYVLIDGKQEINYQSTNTNKKVKLQCEDTKHPTNQPTKEPELDSQFATIQEI